MKMASAGTMESNDCYITVKEHHELKVEIESIVIDQFGDQIDKVIRETLEQLNVKKIFVHCNDKGALDYTIKARLITAVARMEGSNA